MTGPPRYRVAAKSRLGCRFGSGKSSSNRSSSWSSATAAASCSYAGDSSRLSRANSRYLWAVFTVTRCQVDRPAWRLDVEPLDGHRHAATVVEDQEVADVKRLGRRQVGACSAAAAIT